MYIYYALFGLALSDYSPLAMKVRSRSGSVGRSGTNTPGGGVSKMLSEGDLRKANTALKLSQVNGEGEAEAEAEGKGEGKGEGKEGAK